MPSAQHTAGPLHVVASLLLATLSLGFPVRFTIKHLAQGLACSTFWKWSLLFLTFI